MVRFFEATRQHVRTEEEATEQSATTDGPTEGSSQEEDLQRVRGSWMMLEYVGCILSDSLVTGQRPVNGCKSVSSGFHTALSFHNMSCQLQSTTRFSRSTSAGS